MYPPTPKPAAGGGPERAIARRPRVLLVDDDSAVRAFYRAEMEEWGYFVLEAPSADAALRSCRNSRLDLVVLDVRLGTDCGLVLLRLLRELRPNMLIVLLTAYPAYREDFASWLADSFCLKSSDTTPLREVLCTLLLDAASTEFVTKSR